MLNVVISKVAESPVLKGLDLALVEGTESPMPAGKGEFFLTNTYEKQYYWQ